MQWVVYVQADDGGRKEDCALLGRHGGLAMDVLWMSGFKAFFLPGLATARTLDGVLADREADGARGGDEIFFLCFGFCHFLCSTIVRAFFLSTYVFHRAIARRDEIKMVCLRADMRRKE
jgi:hypothetical protein